MCDYLGLTGICDDSVLREEGDGDDFRYVHLFCKCSEHASHTNPWILGISYRATRGIKVDRSEL